MTYSDLFYYLPLTHYLSAEAQPFPLRLDACSELSFASFVTQWEESHNLFERVNRFKLYVLFVKQLPPSVTRIRLIFHCPYVRVFRFRHLLCVIDWDELVEVLKARPGLEGVEVSVVGKYLAKAWKKDHNNRDLGQLVHTVLTGEFITSCLNGYSCSLADIPAVVLTSHTVLAECFL